MKYLAIFLTVFIVASFVFNYFRFVECREMGFSKFYCLTNK